MVISLERYSGALFRGADSQTCHSPTYPAPTAFGLISGKDVRAKRKVNQKACQAISRQGWSRRLLSSKLR